MHALETMRSALRPHGLLLDVRPARRHPWVAIRHGDAADRSKRLGKVVRVGQVDDSYRLGTLASADEALLTLIDAGCFIQERAETFTFVYHFDSIDNWLAYMAEHWSTAKISGEVIDQAQDALSRETGEVLVLRAIRAARLRRL